MSQTRFLSIAVVLICSLTACGQRGPLYLPDETATPAVPAQSTHAEDALEADLETEDNLQDNEG